MPKDFFKTTRCAALLSASAILLSTHVYAADLDKDGIADDIEVQIGFDPKNADSNTDGLPDRFQALKAGLINEDGSLFAGSGMLRSANVAAAACDPTDCDADGVGDFLETYGYYFLRV